MIDWAVSHVPVKHRTDAFMYLFVVFAFALGFATNLLYREHVVTQVRVTHPGVKQLLGHPVQSVAGAQINQALTGLTCDVYASGQTLRALYCHH